MISHEALLAALHYAPETGIWTRLISYTNRVKVGDRADRPAKRKKPHCTVAILGKQYTSHRLAWFYMTGEWPPALVDHEDTDATNNRWRNLRLADKAQNAWNSPAHKDNACGVKGVYFDARYAKWIASIFVRGKKIHLGTHETLKAAAGARRAGAQQYHGSFARA